MHYSFRFFTGLVLVIVLRARAKSIGVLIAGLLWLASASALFAACENQDTKKSENAFDGSLSTVRQAEETGPSGSSDGDEAHKILPFVDCVAIDSAERSFAIFGYDNQNDKSVSVPRGPDNELSPLTDIGPPVWFSPGSHSGVLVVELQPSATWTVGGNEAVAIFDATKTCPVDEDGGGESAELEDGTLVPIYSKPNGGIIPTEEIDDYITAGTLDGSFAVTHDGAATYSVPIWVPPGQGLEPSLSLNYNSRGGNGLFGLGWSLSGDVISQITRCRPNVAQDGYTRAISFDRGDAFCLDGKRLVAVSGPYGSEGTEYRTEEDSYTKIVSGEVDWLGPKEFTAYLKNGRVVTYGGDANAVIEGYRASYVREEDEVFPEKTGAKGRYAWKVSEVQDRSGNRITLEYELFANDGTNGDFTTEHILDFIRYEAFAEDGARKVLRQVSLAYYFGSDSNPRPDKFTRYISGLKLTTSRRVKSVVVEAGLSEDTLRPLKAYVLRYENEPKNNLSILTSIQECDSGHVCKKPTTFGYTPYDIDFVRQSELDIPDFYGKTYESPKPALEIGDLNGDGRDDVVFKTWADSEQSSTHISYALSTGTGFDEPVVMTERRKHRDIVKPVDVDMDGRTELIIAAPKSVSRYAGPDWEDRIDHWVIYRWTPEGLRAVNDGPDSPELPYRSVPSFGILHPDNSFEVTAKEGPLNIYAGDMTGDGLPELLRAQGGAPWSKINGVTEFLGTSVWGARLNPGGWPEDYRKMMFMSSPPDPENPVWTLYGDRTFLADIDGSGRLALISPFPDYDHVPGSGDRFQDKIEGIPYAYRKYYMVFNHAAPWPGAEDPLLVDFNSGKGLTIVNDSQPGINTVLPWTFYLMADVNGDGLSDAVGYPVNGGHNISVAYNYGGDFATPMSAAGQLGPKFKIGQSVPLTGMKDNRSGYPLCVFDFISTLDNGLRVADIDQDGRQDLVLMDTGVANLVAEVKFDQNRCDLYWSTGVGGREFVSYLRVDDDGNWREAELTPEIPIDRRPTFSLEPRSFGTSKTADVNGDGLTDLVYLEGDTKLVVWTQRGKGGMLRSVDDAYGRQVNVEYKPLSDPSVHTPDRCKAPLYCMNRGMWVVSAHEVNSGTADGMNRFEHTYKGATSDLAGRGWLGFRSHRVLSESTNTETTTVFDPDMARTLALSLKYPRAYPLAGKPIAETKKTTFDQHHILEIGTHWSYDVKVDTDTGSYRVDVDHIATRNREGDPALGLLPIVDTSLTEFTYDSFGNVITKESVITDYPIYPYNRVSDLTGDKTLVFSTYDNDADNWLIGLERTRTVINTTEDGKVEERKFAYDYEPGTNLLRVDTTEPGAGGNLETSRIYDRDSHGQVVRITDRTANESDRVTEIAYDRFTGSLPAQIVNPEGHMITKTYEPLRGLVTTITEPNGATSSFEYDGFCRLRAHTRPDGGVESTNYTIAAGSNNLELITEAPEVGLKMIDHDVLERPITWVSSNFAGEPRTTTSAYDPRFGGVVEELGPSDSGTTGIKSTTATDLAGRVILQQTGLDVTTFAYDLRDITISEPIERVQILEHNPIGEMTARLEKNGTSTIKTTYGYLPFGLLETITDNQGNVTRFKYDKLGRRTRAISESSGTTVYKYNGFGDLIEQYDPDGVSHFYWRDRLGRVTREVISDNVNLETAMFIWDEADHGIGSIARDISFDNIATDYAYDSIGRLARKTKTVEDAPYAVDLAYDEEGRLKTILYPEIDEEMRFGVDYVYRPNGELEKVTRTGTAREYWRADARNARGQPKEETFGNDVTVTRSYEDSRGLASQVVIEDGMTRLDSYTYEYDFSRLLKRRFHPDTGTEEIFTYDPLNRLEYWKGKQGSTDWTVRYNYDDLGNLTGRTYTKSGITEDIVYEYSGVNAGPDAITRSPWGSYSYDAKGNRIAGPGNTITYTAFNLPREIMNASGSRSIALYKYDASNRRTLKRIPGTNATTIYVDNLFEYRTTEESETFVHYILADDNVVAQVNWSHEESGLNAFYMHSDRLGSVEMATTDTTLGSISTLGPRQLDPFGNEVDIANPVLRGPGSKTPTPLDSIRLGFTGHEEDFALGLVNMKGRIYDPKVARFLSTDPVLGNLSSQALNRYSYVLNDPLNQTDPSGFESLHEYIARNFAQLPNDGEIDNQQLIEMAEQNPEDTIRVHASFDDGTTATGAPVAEAGRGKAPADTRKATGGNETMTGGTSTTTHSNGTNLPGDLSRLGQSGLGQDGKAGGSSNSAETRQQGQQTPSYDYKQVIEELLKKQRDISQPVSPGGGPKQKQDKVIYDDPSMKPRQTEAERWLTTRGGSMQKPPEPNLSERMRTNAGLSDPQIGIIPGQPFSWHPTCTFALDTGGRILEGKCAEIFKLPIK